ncbi:collagen-like protein [Flavobacterium sp. MDT1-60]|uniref:collagen-like protein n=1 Tax=Flavobacterium sp. MDT1-60 TaxID=1979344 RepID=UPI00177FAF5F|nr:collagen-like protein [Flavobacterium sp. MDT1-60]QOG00556.1 collagen-like protein [Flavobacterium sp. MDT1-60]
MKNRLLPLFVVLGTFSAHSQVGVGTLNPKSSAQLEVFSNNKGMLIPQIALTSTTDNKTIVNGNIISLLVYNTTDNANITPGYYYWFDNRWNRMLISGDLTAIAGNSVPGAKGETGYPGENITIYTDKSTSTVYVQNSDGTWTPINGSGGTPGKDGKSAFEIWKEISGNEEKTVTEYLASLKGDKGDKGEVGVAGGTGAPGNKGEAGYPGKDINMYVDNSSGDVYVQKPDGTWTPINGKDGEVGTAGGNGVPGNKGEAGYPGKDINIYTDKETNTVYVQNADGTWTPITGAKGDKGEVGVAGGTGTPGNKGEAGYPGKDINMYVDNSTGDVYVQKPDGTWTPINGKDGEVGTAGGNGVPGNKGEAGYPGKDINIYTDKETNTVYVQNADGTWTPITGAKGDKGEVGIAGGTGAPGNKGEAGYPGKDINMYVDNSTGDVYVQKPDGTWTPINGKDGEVGTAGGNGVPANKGEAGYPGKDINIYTDKETNTVYVQNADGTWTPITGAKGDKGEVGVAGGTGAPGNKGEAGYPGKDINMYVDNSSGDVYVQKPDGTWTPINGKDGEVGTAGGNGVPANKGEAGYPGKDINIYTDKETNTVYVQNADGTWTPINGKDGKSALEIWKELPGNDGKSITEFLDGLKGEKGDKGEVGTAAGAGAPGIAGTPGAPGKDVNIYTDTETSTVYVQNPDGTWTSINGKDGKSAFEIWKELPGNDGKSITEFLDGLKGEKGDKGEVGTAAGAGAPGIAGTPGAPGKDVNIYTDTETSTVYVQNPDGTWTSINGKDGKSALEIWKELPGNDGKSITEFLDGLKGEKGDKGEVGTAAGAGAPGIAGTPGAPGKDVNIYTDTETSTVYVQNPDGTWTPINGKDGEVGTAAGAGAPGIAGTPGAPGKDVNIYTDTETSTVYVQNPDGTWTSINGKDGKSAFEIWKELPGNDGKSITEFLDGLKGEKGEKGEVGTAAGAGVPGIAGTPGAPGKDVNIYTDTETSTVYVQNPDGTWTPINGKDGEVGTAAGAGAPGIAGTPGAPGKDVNIYTDTETSTVYVQNPDGTWTSINGKDGKSAFEIWKELPGNDGKSITEFLDGLKGEKGDKGEVGTAAGTGVPGIAGTPGAPGKDVSIYTDTETSTVYVQNPDGTWTPINGKDGEVGTAAGAGVPGIAGTPGAPGKDVNIYTDTETSTVYVQNPDGTWTSINGKDGKSAFEIWKELPGNDGKSITEYLDGLKGADGVAGADGKSAFEIWKELPGNDGKSITEYLDGLKGADGVAGADGKSAFEIWKELPGNDGKSITEYLDGLKGADGVAGADGKSAFEIWKEISGNEGKTVTEYLASLKGDKGDKGDAGKDFEYTDFTPTQLAGLKGDKGDKGDAGKDFEYTDFTPTQLAGLKGDKGDKGDAGKDFEYTDFTPTQLAGLKGDKGDKGNAGKDFEYTDFTPTQLAGLKGDKGDKGDAGKDFEYTDFTPTQLAGLKGDKGDKGDAGKDFEYTDFTPTQLAGLKGDKGDKGDAGKDFEYTDFTPTQLAGLKGDKGDKGDAGKDFEYTDFTPTQLAGLKGDKGDKGDAGKDFEYTDFTPTQLAGLKGDKGDTGTAGAAGAQGPIGLTGATGPQGLQGLQGPIGLTGATGPQGIQGLAGIGGKTTAGTNVTITGAGTDASPYIVNATVPQQLTQAIDEFTAMAGQSSFTLAAMPSSLSKVKFYINGVRIDKDALTINGSVVSYNPTNNGSYALMANDNVIIDYLK